MNSSKIMRDRKLAGVALRQLVRSTVAGASNLVPKFGSDGVTKLLISPQDIRTSDPTLASEFFAGQIKLAGKLLETHGASPFGIPCPTVAFEENLHSFEWLRHFRAADEIKIRNHARVLVAEWIRTKARNTSEVARQTDVTARRLISWLAQSSILLEGVDSIFYNQFIESISADAKLLRQASRRLPSNHTLLFVQIALTHFAVSASERDSVIKRESVRLSDLLNEQILSDGGHVSRSPAVLLSLLLDLLPLKLAFLWRRIQTPQAIVSAIDRMIPMLRMMRHSDGSVALFNGMASTRADILAAVLSQDDTKAPAILNAPYSGYQRVQHGKSVLIIDAGAAPKPPLASLVHAAPGAFEFSVDGGRLIVNCGSPPLHRPEMKAIARKTAAHSTLIYNDNNIGQFVSSPALNELVGNQYFGGPKKVNVARGTTDEGSIVTVKHDGLKKLYGLTHERRFALSSDGLNLEGEDILIATGMAQSQPYLLRFHLHPHVKAFSTKEHNVINLVMPNGAQWQFITLKGEAHIEESIFLASPDGFRRTDQIVVEADFPRIGMIPWAFRKI